MIRKVLLLLCFLSIPFLAFAEIQVYFSPNGGCTDAIVSELQKANKTIDIMVYSFTSRPIAQEIVKAKERGVKVRILFDKHQATEKYSKSRYFLSHGIPIRLNTGNGLMHNKVGIIDSNVLITGSFNWTAQAEKYNQENLLIIKDQTLIEKYQQRFEELWQSGQSFN